MAVIVDEPKPKSATIPPLGTTELERLAERLSQGETLSQKRLSQKEALSLFATLKDPSAFREAVSIFQLAFAKSQDSQPTPEMLAACQQAALVLSNRCELMLDAPQWFHTVDRIDDPSYRVLTVDAIDAVLENIKSSGANRLWVGGGLDSQLMIPGLEGASLLPTLKKLLGYLNDKKPDGVSLEGFSLDYWEFLSVVTGKTPTYLLNFLQDYEIKALYGWGSDCLVSPTREAISKKKLDLNQWRELTEMAFSQGMSVVPSMTVGLGQTPQSLLAHLDTMHAAAQVFLENRDENALHGLILPLEIYSAPWDRAVYPEGTGKVLVQRLKLLQWVMALYWTQVTWNQGVGCATLSLPNWTAENQQEFALEQREIQVYPETPILPSQIATQGLMHGMNFCMA
jgi:hypothetical protein